jgi:hypothetical protein
LYSPCRAEHRVHLRRRRFVRHAQRGEDLQQLDLDERRGHAVVVVRRGVAVQVDHPFEKANVVKPGYHTFQVQGLGESGFKLWLPVAKVDTPGLTTPLAYIPGRGGVVPAVASDVGGGVCACRKQCVLAGNNLNNDPRWMDASPPAPLLCLSLPRPLPEMEAVLRVDARRIATDEWNLSEGGGAWGVHFRQR